MNLEQATALCEKIQAAEREAAELILHAHGILAEMKTGHRDVVTEYDKRVQALLTERLSQAVPGARFYCEESERRDELSAERLFIIDPIDGTMNFVRGFSRSCVSVACAQEGELAAAAIYNPYLDEMFTAVKGGGAFLNGRPIRTWEGPLSESLVCFGTAPYNQALTERTFRLAERAHRASLDVRREGSAALDLCSVAAGRAGAYFELEVSLWDYAAGLLLVREAGGECFTLEGERLGLVPGKTSILAGGPQAGAELLQTLKNPA